ncbi:MAG: ABC transporter permease [Chloroflexi bacterium]|nr:MAG: ABC transporter permease [Chloroflexota bacterium]TMD65220.1 MAG: ABC transporter permease [Chloroflexota bacterium]
MEIIRNLTRRKLRNILTVSGIVIGVLALVTMGAMAEKFNALLDGGVAYFGSNIQVTAAGGSAFGGGSVLPLSTVNQVEQVNGVAAAFPEIQVEAKPGQVSTVSFGLPDYITAYDPRANDYSSVKTTLAQGRDVSSSGEVVLGSDFAHEFNKKAGDSIALPIRPSDAKADFVNHTFTVVGVLTKTQTGPDTGAFINLKDSQMLLKDSLPAAIRDRIDTSTLITGMTVYGKPGVNLDNLADTITNNISAVKATKPSTIVNSFKAGGALFTAITTGAALLALIVGGLSVINTMLMAVTERVREIGLKKAVGAKTRHILREYVLEAVLIGTIGGTIGLLLGWGITSLVNAATASSNLTLFLVSWRLVIIAILFSVGLGAAAGIIPALRASRMDPVRALRSAA